MKTLIGEMSMLLRDIFLYLNFAFFVFALPFFAAIRWNIRTEKSFFPALILNSMIFYFFAIFHKSTPGFWIIYSVNMALYLPFIFIAGKKKREELGLDTAGYCDTSMIADWKMELMAKTISEVYIPKK